MNIPFVEDSYQLIFEAIVNLGETKIIDSFSVSNNHEPINKNGYFF